MIASVTPDLTLEINGEKRTVPRVASLSELLSFLEIREERVAVELNRKIVRRAEWAVTTLVDNDHLEIVQFVGGG